MANTAPSFPASMFPYPPTAANVQAYCTRNNLSSTTITLPLATNGGDPSAFPGKLHSFTIPLPTPTSSSPSLSGPALLYLHGGGYLIPAQIGHMALARFLGEHLHTPTIHILEYSLAPDGKYPLQLLQGILALTHILATTAPAQLTLGGDSAGANLTLGLLAHLASPKPGLPAVRLAAPLRAAVCISPRCANHTRAASFTYNAGKDVISKGAAEFIFENWQPVDGEVWAAANDAPNPDFWPATLASTVQRLLVLAGQDECYLDDIREFAEKAGAVEARLGDAERVWTEGSRLVFVAEGAKHAQISSDFEANVRDGAMTRALVEWAKGSRP